MSAPPNPEPSKRSMQPLPPSGLVLLCALWAFPTPLHAGLGTQQDSAASQEDSDPKSVDPLRLSDVPIGPQVDKVPKRPEPLFEYGDPFLGTGEIKPGLPLFTGQVLQPDLLFYGTGRLGLQTFSPGGFRGPKTSEAVARLDLYANYQLSGTERFFASIRPIDEGGQFTRYTLDSVNEDEGFEFEGSTQLQTIFFEGDFGEIFPGLDPMDSSEWDLGFSVGRQRVALQDGLLLNDRMDSLGITRNSILPTGTSNYRMTALLAVDDIRRSDGVNTDEALLFALANEADLPIATVSLDGVYVKDQKGKEDAFFLGAGAVRRFGKTNAALRVVSSFPEQSRGTKSSQGTLIFSEISRNRAHSDDLMYSTWFLGINDYATSARDGHGGGPLDRAGILFNALRLSRYTTALSNDVEDAMGGAIGLQTYLGDEEHRHQLVLELGWRLDTEDIENSDRESLAVGFRYEQAVGQHLVWRIDGFLVGRNNFQPGGGIRTEFLVKF